MFITPRLSRIRQNTSIIVQKVNKNGLIVFIWRDVPLLSRSWNLDHLLYVVLYVVER